MFSCFWWIFKEKNPLQSKFNAETVRKLIPYILYMYMCVYWFRFCMQREAWLKAYVFDLKEIVLHLMWSILAREPVIEILCLALKISLKISCQSSRITHIHRERFHSLSPLSLSLELIPGPAGLWVYKTQGLHFSCATGIGGRDILG